MLYLKYYAKLWTYNNNEQKRYGLCAVKSSWRSQVLVKHSHKYMCVCVYNHKLINTRHWSRFSRETKAIGCVCVCTHTHIYIYEKERMCICRQRLERRFLLRNWLMLLWRLTSLMNCPLHTRDPGEAWLDSVCPIAREKRRQSEIS